VRSRTSLAKNQWNGIYNHFDGAVLIRWLNGIEAQADDPKSNAARIVAQWLKDREATTREKCGTGAGFHTRTILTAWLACKIKKVTGEQRFGDKGSEAYKAVSDRLKLARPAFDIADALGGDGFFLVFLPVDPPSHHSRSFRNRPPRTLYSSSWFS
jgi:hypothetical protein